MTEEYKKSGVDTSLASRLPGMLSGLVFSSKREWVEGGLGGFSSIIDLSKVDGTSNSLGGRIAMTCDGVGTKLLLAGGSEDYVGMGRDAVAMCVNDLLTVFARPIALMDYVAMGKIEEEILKKLVEGITFACREVGCSLVGGETAEMPGVYKNEDVDIACFAVGVVDERVKYGQDMEEGDVVLGLPSVGVHSNGFSLVRKILTDNNVELDNLAPFESDKATLRQELLKPTRLYHREVFEIMDSGKGDSVLGMAHITGGGLADNIERSLGEGKGCLIYRDSWKIPKVFNWLEKDCGVSSRGMWGTFNMGIGYVVIVRGSDFRDEEWQEFIKIGEIVGKDKVSSEQRVEIV